MDFEIIEQENSFKKFRLEPSSLLEGLTFLKNTPEHDFDRLNTIIAVDLQDKFELIYDLFSINTGNSCRVSALLDRNTPHISSAVEIYKSAYFDECEIYDMFGVKFDGNPNLKRLLMPKGWQGHPLRKDYEQSDERLVWNE